jgi:hypothetical protein
MLEVRCPEHLEAVRAFARSISLEHQLQEQLDFLRDYGNRGKPAEEMPEESRQNLCILERDFAPRSFAFGMFGAADENGKRRFLFNGGLIYQGLDSPANGGFPSLCVSLAPGTGWFIRT